MTTPSLLSCIGVLLALLAGCAAAPAYVPDPQPLETGRLPAPDLTLDIPGLGPCTDAADRRVHLNSREPVTVLVHGCKGSAGRFSSLAQLYAFHGQYRKNRGKDARKDARKDADFSSFASQLGGRSNVDYPLPPPRKSPQ